MPLTIRRGAQADVDIIVEFNRRLAQETEDKTLDIGILRAGVLAALADEAKGPYFLAEENGQVLGQMQITYEFSDWRNGWFWWIQGVYVRVDARGRGVFRALYQHVYDLARRDPGVIGLRLYVERENHSAQRTYVKLGMRETNYLMLERCPLL